MSAHASARRTAFSEIELHFPYSADLVEDLKETIPARFRRWDAEDRVWRVLGAYATEATDWLLEHFPRAEVPGDQARPVRLVAHTVRPPDPPRPPLPPLIVETPAPTDQGR